MLRARVVLATLFASILSSVVARADDVRSDTARFGGYFQGGVEIGFAPGQTSVLPGLFSAVVRRTECCTGAPKSRWRSAHRTAADSP
ncbi:MAG: hypothetical protein U0235_25110 [Polyangiaceae bacterium]